MAPTLRVDAELQSVYRRDYLGAARPSGFVHVLALTLVLSLVSLWVLFLQGL